MRKEFRVAAYAVCVRDEQVLLSRLVGRDVHKCWTLPGGGMDHGEDPYDTVIREVEEETGYTVEPVSLLGIDSLLRNGRPRFGSPRLGTASVLHALRIVYECRITGGRLRSETGGSTDLAAWHPLADVPALDRVGLLDAGLALWRSRPADGRASERTDGSPARSETRPGAGPG